MLPSAGAAAGERGAPPRFPRWRARLRGRAGEVWGGVRGGFKGAGRGRPSRSVVNRGKKKKNNRPVLPVRSLPSPLALGRLVFGRAGWYFPLAIPPQETGTGMSGISVLLG